MDRPRSCAVVVDLEMDPRYTLQSIRRTMRSLQHIVRMGRSTRDEQRAFAPKVRLSLLWWFQDIADDFAGECVREIAEHDHYTQDVS